MNKLKASLFSFSVLLIGLQAQAGIFSRSNIPDLIQEAQKSSEMVCKEKFFYGGVILTPKSVLIRATEACKRGVENGKAVAEKMDLEGYDEPLHSRGFSIVLSGVVKSILDDAKYACKDETDESTAAICKRGAELFAERLELRLGSSARD